LIDEQIKNYLQRLQRIYFIALHLRFIWLLVGSLKRSPIVVFELKKTVLIRQKWTSEVRDFTPWLENNMLENKMIW